MTLERPPVTASWILVHFSDADEGLIGDLFEEYLRRGSAFWYWRQVAIAIVVGFVRGVLNHKLETIQAVFTAFAALIVGGQFVNEPLLRLLSTLVGRSVPLPPRMWNTIFMWTSVIVWFAITIAAGALIARLHPTRRATMTFATMCFLAALNVPEWYRLITNVFTSDSRFLPYLANSVGYFLIVAVGLPLGCLWNKSAVPAARPHETASTPTI
jgi:hypothetical protein